MHEIVDISFDYEFGVYAVLVTDIGTAWKWMWSCECGFKSVRQYFRHAEKAWKSSRRKDEFMRIPLNCVEGYRKGDVWQVGDTRVTL